MKKSIRKRIAADTCNGMSTTSYVRDIIMENMEKALVIWIEDQTQKKISVNTISIANKALSNNSELVTVDLLI